MIASTMTDDEVAEWADLMAHAAPYYGPRRQVTDDTPTTGKTPWRAVQRVTVAFCPRCQRVLGGGLWCIVHGDAL